MPPTPVPTQSEAPLFVRWSPRVLTIVAVFMLVQLITPAGSWLDRFFEFMWRWFVPFTPVDFVTSVVFIVLAAPWPSASGRRGGSRWSSSPSSSLSTPSSSTASSSSPPTR
ncbi:hypothetical protein IOD13_02165 [Brevibacterium casei]|nr:hypothetical protein [Brevibacterium casei]